MSHFFEKKAEKKYQQLSILVMFFSGLIILGWLLKLTFLVNPLPNGSTMPFVSAILYFFIALTLLLNQKTILFKRLFLGLGWFLMLFAAFSLFQTLSGLSLGLENWFIKDTISNANMFRIPGRMSIIESIGFIVFGGAFLADYYEQSWIRRITEPAILVLYFVAMIGVVAVCFQMVIPERFFFGLTSIFSYFFFRIIGHLFCLRSPPLFSPLRLYMDHTPGSRLVQIITPFILIATSVVGTIILFAIENDYASPGISLGLFLTSSLIFTTLLVFNLGFNTDKIDADKLALELSLEKSNKEKNYFQQALESSSMFAILDNKWHYKYVSDTFCENFEYTREELIGQPPLTITTKTNDNARIEKVMQFIIKNTSWQGEFQIETKTGEIRMIEATIVSFWGNKNEKVYQFLAVYHDITQRIIDKGLLAAQNKYLELKNEEVERQSKEIEQFAYIASHDLQEPLRTIMNYSELLKEDYEGKLDATADLSLNFIAAAAHRMSELIKGVLDYSRMGVEKEKTSVNCNQILQDVRDDLKEKIKETGVQLEVQKMPIIIGYKMELRLLFQNLILNGIKFKTPTGNAFVHVTVEKTEDSWLFKVTDNGIGIREEDLEKVFVIFQRLNHAKDYEGTGIGLSHCQKIVNLHGGKIWVKSTFGKGSTFCFTIPFNEPKQIT